MTTNGSVPKRSMAWGPLRRRNKFGAHSVVYKGRRYASQAEADHAATLRMLRHAADSHERVTIIVCQPTLILQDEPRITYRPDFKVTFADGRTEYHEVKGFETPEWKLKEKLFRARYPDLILKVIKKEE